MVNVLALVKVLALLLATAAPDPRCLGLADLSSADMTIERAELSVSAPAPTNEPARRICRVRGVARPGPSSRVGFEVWLPAQGWTGRYVQLGNGGFAGNIDLPGLAAESAHGNAAAMTDTGHRADRFDASWAAGQPERIADYGHRSIKATSDAARALIRAYYGRAPDHRYFVGCSNGGRQALMAAQRYPQDWDGIVAGAPANLWTDQLVSFASLQHHLRTRPGAWIATGKLPAIQRAALAACPPGSVARGAAQQPESCRFDPAVLLCRGAETDTCLTARQVESVRRIQAAGFEATAAAAPDGWARWIVNPDPSAPSQLTFAVQAFRYLFGANPRWSIADFDPDHARPPAEIRRLLDAETLDFSAFRARGGRIISYFGWADALISPHASLAYYRRVMRRTGGPERTLDFYRLFMVPGMAHCQGGVGPTSFGQSLPAPSLGDDRRYDIRRALEAWVERKLAPDQLIAAGDGAIQELRPSQ